MIFTPIFFLISERGTSETRKNIPPNIFSKDFKIYSKIRMKIYTKIF